MNSSSFGQSEVPDYYANNKQLISYCTSLTHLIVESSTSLGDDVLPSMYLDKSTPPTTKSLTTVSIAKGRAWLQILVMPGSARSRSSTSSFLNASLW